MSEKDINRWHDTITPREKAPQPWTIGSGGSWDMLEVQPIPDAMLAELAQLYNSHGCPWNCRSMPLSASDREYMFLLYYSMQGLVARMRLAEKAAADLRSDAMTMALRLYGEKQDTFAPETAEVMGRWRPLVEAMLARSAS
jgi:hypothetical protein